MSYVIIIIHKIHIWDIRIVLANFANKGNEYDFSSFGANGWIGLKQEWVIKIFIYLFIFPWFNLMRLMLLIRKWTLTLYFLFIVKRRFWYNWLNVRIFTYAYWELWLNLKISRFHLHEKNKNLILFNVWNGDEFWKDCNYISLIKYVS